jgi:hypothetical protein
VRAPSNLASIGGQSAKFSPKGILVERGNAPVTMMLLWLVEKPGAPNVLVDPTGQTYTSLEDFRERNTLLTPDDKISAPSDIMSPVDTGRSISTTGHATPSTPWWPWLVGGVLLVVVAAAVWITLSRRRRRVQAMDLAKWMIPGDDQDHGQSESVTS